MTKRDVIRAVLEGKRPPYVPWHFQFTFEAREAILAHLGGEEALETALQVVGMGRGDAVRVEDLRQSTGRVIGQIDGAYDGGRHAGQAPGPVIAEALQPAQRVAQGHPLAGRVIVMLDVRHRLDAGGQGIGCRNPIGTVVGKGQVRVVVAQGRLSRTVSRVLKN